MNMELGLPNINATTEREQLSQIRSYLYRLVPELQFALRAQTGAEGNAAAPSVCAISTGVWQSLGLSEAVSKTAVPCGRLGRSGCAYRACETERKLCVAFCCALTYAGEPVRVNEKALPKHCRPRADVYAICAAEGGIACVCVTAEGEVRVEWAQKTDGGASQEIGWIDGAAEYCY